jgi:hypothetical protein
VALTRPGGLLTGLTRQVLQTALETELTEHLGHEHGGTPGPGRNVRNGLSAKTVRTEIGPVSVKVPRDRAGTFEPVLVPKHGRRLTGRPACHTTPSCQIATCAKSRWTSNPVHRLPITWLDVARRHGARPRLLVLDARGFPHDIATLGRYGRALDGLPPARHPWSPLDVRAVLAGLDAAGVQVTDGSGHLPAG